MRKSTRFFPVFLILSSLISFAHIQDTVAQAQKSFLWKVRSNTGTVYLLGSIHFLKKDVYPLDKKIETAFDQSDVLVVEANIHNIGQVDLQKFLASALYPPDQTLEKHVSAETYDLVKKASERLGLPLELMARQKPWFLALMVSSMELLRSGFDPRYGIDSYFLSKATGKRILELENLDYQINLLSGFSDHDQELFLSYTLKDLSALNREADQLLRAWASGDTKSVESILTRTRAEDERISSIYERLIYERNGRMASRIGDFLKSKETSFVVVGAGHLVGKRGIVELLRDKGYLIEQL